MDFTENMEQFYQMNFTTEHACVSVAKITKVASVFFINWQNKKIYIS